jgi:transposase
MGSRSANAFSSACNAKSFSFDPSERMLCAKPRETFRQPLLVEGTFAWLNQFRRLRVRYEKRADIHEAFLSLGCALICWRFLRIDWRQSEN